MARMLTSSQSSFPRHQRRGLIEAQSGMLARPLRSVFPRHQRRGLIEASRMPMSSLARKTDFRAIKGAVSLKQLARHRAPRWIPGGFPRHQRRGLIEASSILAAADLPLLFPRHQRRGLIEAHRVIDSGGCLVGFPRHQRRGLIEANSLQTSRSAFCPYFRAIKGAVSLKQNEIMRAEVIESEFPRHQRRGLIEAKLPGRQRTLRRLISAPSKARSH